MMKNVHTLTKSVLVASLFAAAAPALADDDERIYAQNRGQYITHKAAAAKALKKVGGGRVKDVDFEYHGSSNRAYFDVEVVNKKGLEYDVRLDARTGRVVYSRRDY